MKIIVVGAVAGGATVASQIRRSLPSAEITVYEKDRDMSFANCGLPYYLGQEVASRDELVQATKELFVEKKNITVKTFHEVIGINAQEHTVTVYDHKEKREFTDTYDRLILSPGCRATLLEQVEDTTNVFYLRNLMDTDAIETHIVKKNVKNALVVGAGFVSLEIAENFTKRGIDVTLVHRSNRIFKPTDHIFCQELMNTLEDNNVTLQLSDEVKSVEGKHVVFKSGKEADFDIIIISIGITPNTSFVGEDVSLNEEGYIQVNEYFETSSKDIYALGDAIETFYRHTKQPTKIALAWGTHRAASLIADNFSGKDIPFQGLLGTNIVRVFNRSIASVGLSEDEVEEYDYEHIVVSQKDRAGYMKDAKKLTISVYYDKKTRLLYRASLFGESGVAKRADIIATAMINNMTIDEFKDIEVAYAPPYASPKDIVNMLGYKAK